jgi:hypothetical protein
MTQEEFNTLRPGFPWREVIHPGPRGRPATVQVLDRFGNDIPLLTLVEFSKFMTAKLAAKEEAAQS